MTPPDAPPLPSPLPATLMAYLRQQPRAVRMFNRRLEVLWDNCPDRAAEFPLFAGPTGAGVTVPPPGPERNAWPVQRVLEHGQPAERFYVPAGPDAPAGTCLRLRAWPLESDAGEFELVVEEIDRVSSRICFDERLKTLDEELAELIDHVAAVLSGEEGAHALRLRLTNPNLQPCHEIKQCERETCPAYANEENPRCWDVDNTLCHKGMEVQNPLGKFRYCDQCKVYLLACPDPLTRVGENFNRLLSLLNLKHQEALEAQQHVQQADKLATVGELMLGLAHEVKTPLSVIIGRLDCLALELESLTLREIGEDLEVMRQHAQRMSTVLKDVLTLARPAPPSPRALDLATSVREALAMATTTLERARIRVENEVPTGLPTVFADPLQIQQVLLNLIINARDAMPDGGVLRLETRVAEGEADVLELHVRDSGHGIAPEDQQRVFSPFYTTKAERGGTGLGLAVCQRIMMHHGGRIRVESRPGAGTTIVLSFCIHEGAVP